MRGTRILNRLFAGLLFAYLSVSSGPLIAYGGTWHVPGDETLQDAIDLAHVSGEFNDVILIRGGYTVTGPVTVYAGITIKKDPDPSYPDLPVIQGHSSTNEAAWPDYVINVGSIGSADIKLDSLVIRHGKLSLVKTFGSSPSGPTHQLEMSNCILDGASTAGTFANYGYFTDQYHSYVHDCTFQNFEGGCVVAGEPAEEEIGNIRLWFEGNVFNCVGAQSSGVRLYCWDSDVRVKQNTFYGSMPDTTNDSLTRRAAIQLLEIDDGPHWTNSVDFRYNLITGSYRGVTIPRAWDTWTVNTSGNLLYEVEFDQSPSNLDIWGYMVETNPLFRDPEAGDFSVHINSVTTRSHNPYGIRFGAKRISIAYGALTWNNTALEPEDVDPRGIDVTGDLAIGYLSPGTYAARTLLLEGPIVVKCGSPSGTNFGYDNTKTEIVLYSYGLSTLVGGYTSGPSFQKVTGGSSWGGIISRLAGGVLNLEHATVRDADYGITIESDYENEVIGCLLTNNTYWDIKIAGSAGSAGVTDCTLEVGAGSGIEVLGPAAILANSIAGTGASSNGIVVGGPAQDEYDSPAANRAVIDGNTVTGFSNGAGIKVASSYAEPTILRNTVYTSLYGVHVAQGSPVIGTRATSSDNLLMSNSYGAYVRPIGGGDCPGGDGNFFPKFQNNNISYNSSGIFVEKTINVNLGTYASGDTSYYGKNSFEWNDNACIWESGVCGTVIAIGNYYGESGPGSCAYGSVNTGYYLTTSPASAGRQVAVEAVIEVPQKFSAYPNPATSSVVFRAGSARSTSEVSLQILDIAGRLVWDSGPRVWEIGSDLSVNWDLHNQSNEPVSHGLYFGRLVTQTGTKVTKLYVSNQGDR